MKKIVYLFGCVMLLALFSSCDRNNETQTETGDITGVVFDQDGEPRRGVQVTLSQILILMPGSAPPAANIVSTMVTGSNGAFVFSDIPTGNYHISVLGANGWHHVGVTVRAGMTVNSDIATTFRD